MPLEFYRCLLQKNLKKMCCESWVTIEYYVYET